jgi:hypothetical protein
MSARSKTAALALASALAIAAAAPAQAAPVYTVVDQDLSTGSYDITYKGGTITFANGIGFPSYIAVSTSGTGAVRTVFGNPSTDFTDRGYAFYDANTLGGFGSVAVSTPIYATNGRNFLGLRVGTEGNYYYGFAYTTDNVLNSYGFENQANTGILGTTAVPEPATWALMIAGFGLVGGAMRRRRTATAGATTIVRYA